MEIKVILKILSTLIIIFMLGFFPSPQENFIIYAPCLLISMIIFYVIWRKNGSN